MPIDLRPIVVLMAATAVSLTGCDVGAPDAAGSARVFSSEEQVRGAAEEAILAYELAVDTAYQTGDPSKLEDVAVDPMLSTVTDATERYRTAGWRQTGSIRIDSVELIYPRSALSPEPDGELAKVCADFADMDMLDAAGESIMDGSRAETLPFIFTLIWKSPSFKVSKIDEWPDESFCR